VEQTGLEWRTPKRSQGASNCVEIGLREWDWCKPVRSTGANNCVETKSVNQHVYVRDTKDRQVGMLTVSPGAWGAFLGHIA